MIKTSQYNTLWKMKIDEELVYNTKKELETDLLALLKMKEEHGNLFQRKRQELAKLKSEDKEKELEDIRKGLKELLKELEKWKAQK